MQNLTISLSRYKIIVAVCLLGCLITGGLVSAYVASVVQKPADKEVVQPAENVEKPQDVDKVTDSNAPASSKDSSSKVANKSDAPSTSTKSKTSSTKQEAAQKKATGAAKPGASQSPPPLTGASPSPTAPAPAPVPSPAPNPTPTPSPTCPAGYSGSYPNCTAPDPSPVGVAGDWQLIMRDEFNGSSLNTNMWTTQRGPSYSYGDPYNPQYEDAYYLANNPKVQSGKLVLTLNQGSTNGYRYSSGMVQNGRHFSYKYGYTEARIKVPGNVGVWPAYWTLAAPVDQSWPPEIDIFEFGLSSQTRPSFNYHYGSTSNPQQYQLKIYGNSSVDYTQDYHTYGMLWTPSKIQVFIDGTPGPSYTNSANITNKPQYLILNLALKKGFTVPSGTAMYVDYVRVWQ